MRGSITFDNGTEFAQHALLRSMLKATTYFCDAYASWQKGGIENAMTINLTPRKCLGYKTPVEAFLSELGKDVEIRFA